MGIVRDDLKLFKSAVFNDTNSNGGAPSNNTVITGISDGVFPTISQAERIAGSTKYRKLFAKPDADGQFTLYNTRIYIENPTQADDSVFLFPGTLTDTQAALTGNEKVYGCGWLNVGVANGATEIEVRTESSSKHIFITGDPIRISDKANADDLAGSEEYRTVEDVSWAGNVATITLDAALDNSYSATADATRVASVYEAGETKAAFSSFVVTSSGGTYNSVANPVTLNNKGTVTQDWTLTFTGASTFNIVGSSLGSVGSGNVSSGATPLNPLNSKPYFTLAAAGFGGGYSVGDRIQFTTTAAVKPIWLMRVVPADTPSFTANRFVVTIDGEAD
jgi:hypothetical protein